MKYYTRYISKYDTEIDFRLIKCSTYFDRQNGRGASSVLLHFIDADWAPNEEYPYALLTSDYDVTDGDALPDEIFTDEVPGLECAETGADLDSIDIEINGAPYEEWIKAHPAYTYAVRVDDTDGYDNDFPTFKEALEEARNYDFARILVLTLDEEGGIDFDNSFEGERHVYTVLAYGASVEEEE